MSALMKYLIKIVLLFATVSCTNTKYNFSLEGKIINSDETETVHLTYPVQIDGIWYRWEDTAKIVNGKFRFTGCITETTPAYLSFDNLDEELLYIEPTRMLMEMDRVRPYEYNLSGVSIENEHRQYRNMLGDLPKKLYEQHQYVQTINRQWQEADERSKDALLQKFYDAVQIYKTDYIQMDSLQLHFISEHLEYAIAPHILFLLSKSQDIDHVMLQELFDALPEESKKSVMGQLAAIQIGFEAGEKGRSIGKLAPDFTRLDAIGKLIRLSDYKNKNFVLLDFWASWCKPCLKELPKVKEIHVKYKDLGLQIIGISSDDDISKWSRSVVEHDLNDYPQILSIEQNLAGYEPFFGEQADIGALFNIERIPSYVLIDKGGHIIARWQHIGQEQFTCLDRLLK